MDTREWQICSRTGPPCPESQREAYVTLWVAQRDGVPLETVTVRVGKSLRPFASCVYFGEPVILPSGQQKQEECGACRFAERLKVFVCSHEEAGPETTAKKCADCSYYLAKETT